MFKRHQTKNTVKLAWECKENCKYFHLHASFGCFVNIYTKKVLSCFKFKLELLMVQTCCFALYRWSIEKGWLMMCLILLSHICQPFSQSMRQLFLCKSINDLNLRDLSLSHTHTHTHTLQNYHTLTCRAAFTCTFWPQIWTKAVLFGVAGVLAGVASPVSFSPISKTTL